MKEFKVKHARDVLGPLAETVSCRDHVFTVRRSFFYTHGYTADKFAADITKKISDSCQLVEVLDSGEVWKPFRGGASCAQGSHWFVKFKVVPNRTMVESHNLLSGEKIMIASCDKGSCVDPATETYWSM